MKLRLLALALASVVLAAPSAPSVGEPAPDFALTPLRIYEFRIDERKITRRNAGQLYAPVRLSDFRGKRPVALVFGSATSAIREQLPGLEALHRAYGERVQFLFVYIRGETEGMPAPTTALERMRVANAFASDVGLTIPCLVDDVSDGAMRAYSAHPLRIVLVTREGRIARLGATLTDPALLAGLEELANAREPAVPAK